MLACLYAQFTTCCTCVDGEGDEGDHSGYCGYCGSVHFPYDCACYPSNGCGLSQFYKIRCSCRDAYHAAISLALL